MNRFFRRARNKAVNLGYFVLYATTAAAFYGGLQHYFTANSFPALAAICGPILAVLFAFAALLYNRARALPQGPERRRSLFAAERAMQAACMFMLATAIGGAGVLLLSIVPDVGNKQARPYLTWPAVVLIVSAILLFLLSFGSFYDSVRTVAHTLVRSVPTRRLSRRIRDDA
jgi:hypothetical protein